MVIIFILNKKCALFISLASVSSSNYKKKRATPSLPSLRDLTDLNVRTNYYVNRRFILKNIKIPF